MEKIMNTLTGNWWGIAIICVAALAIWVALSAALYRQFFKRFYDMLLSGVAILCLSPILVILIIVGAIKMKGNPFFTQLRPGKINKKTGKEKIFKLIKFRTMTNAKDKEGNLLPDDKRLTRYGKILRSTSLDELPELFNIFIGHMSIIGPRPLLVSYLPYYTDEERRRHSVRPGLTGLAQVSGRNSVGWDERFQLDVRYVSKISLMGDVKIVFMTAMKVLARSDISENTNASEGNFAEIRKAKLESAEKEVNHSDME